MASRMEKYHGSTSQVGGRSAKNETLYKDIYENTEYSNISNIATLEKTNEISLEQIQELLKEREQNIKRSSTIKREPSRVTYAPERNYDIRDVIEKAKDSHVEDYENRSLRDTQYNILKNIDLNEDKKSEPDIEKTLSNMEVINNYNDNELSLDLLSDLKSSGDTVVEKSDDKKLLKEIEEAKETYEPIEDTGMDKSFYSSSMNFKDEDFEQLKDLQDSIDSNNKLIKVLFFILFLIIAGIAGFIFYKMM